MKRSALVQEIRNKQSCLCVGLDTDPLKIPAHLSHHTNPISAFNKEIIDQTYASCVAYKPNLAFYEAAGKMGWEALEQTMDHIPENLFTIADAKRGDLGNSSKMYARSVFENFNFDSVTVSPYMGLDAIEPFLEYDDKWVIVLALTSNAGSAEFQKQSFDDGEKLYEKVIKRFASLKNVMFVVGATQGESIRKIRELAPENFLLVPGVGAQGGSLEEACKFGFNDECGVLVNSSRGIIYKSSGEDFATAAGQQAKSIQQEMSSLLNMYSKTLI